MHRTSGTLSAPPAAVAGAKTGCPAPWAESLRAPEVREQRGGDLREACTSRGAPLDTSPFQLGDAVI